MGYLLRLACLLMTSASAFMVPSRAVRDHRIGLEAWNRHSLTIEGEVIPTLAGIATAQVFMDAALASDSFEVSDLPPTYVPVLFGVLLLGGVGWLTTSLGDIMTEESLLGLQSGARAKKEMDRSKSSFFKKPR